jgi:hypothetical protein
VGVEPTTILHHGNRPVLYQLSYRPHTEPSLNSASVSCLSMGRVIRFTRGRHLLVCTLLITAIQHNVQNFSTSQFTMSSPGAVCVKNLKPQKHRSLDGFFLHYNWPLSSLCTVIRARLLNLLSDMMSDNRLSLYSVHWFWFTLSCCPDSITITRSSIFTRNTRLSIFAAVKSGGARSESGGAAAPPAPA